MYAAAITLRATAAAVQVQPGYPIQKGNYQSASMAAADEPVRWYAFVSRYVGPKGGPPHI
jgi:hypothetical protein